MQMIIAVLVLFIFVVNIPNSIAAFTCPPMPTAMTEVNHDVKADIKASVGSLGRLKAGEVATKTEITAKNLFEKYPNVDKLLTLQTMAATYCAMLRDTTTLSDAEKINRWERFQERVLNLEATSKPKKINKKINNPLAAALKQNKYEFGWSGDPVGTADHNLYQYAINEVRFESDGFVILKYSRPGGGEIRAVLGGRKLTGTWRDDEGTGELELTFDDSLARAVGWWNYGGQRQKYNAFMRRVK